MRIRTHRRRIRWIVLFTNGHGLTGIRSRASTALDKKAAPEEPPI